MPTSFKKLLRETKKISFTTNEKTSIRNTLSLFIQKNPVRNGLENRHRFQIHQRSFLTLLNWFEPKTAMPIILVITLLVGATTSYAADESLPGDLLYPLKLHVNEGVRGALTLSAEGRAEWEARILERRLEEAEKLALKGEFNTETRENLESRLEDRVTKIQVRIEALEEDEDFESAADISSRFETSLRAHIRILEKLSSNNPDSKTEVDLLLAKLKIKEELAATARKEKESKISSGRVLGVRAAAEGKLKASENKIAEVRKFLERTKESLGAEATAEAEARLKLAEDTITQGRVKLDAELYGDAFVLFQKAHRIAQEAKLLIKARRELEIDLRLNGKFETEEDDGELEVENDDEDEDEDIEEDDENTPEEGDEHPNTIDGNEKTREETNNGTKNRGAIEGGIRIDLGL